MTSFTGTYRPEYLSFVDPKTGWLEALPDEPYEEPNAPVILKTTDGGETWAELASLPEYASITYFKFFDAENGVAVLIGPVAAIYRTRTAAKPGGPVF